MDRKAHWETIYAAKAPTEVSWYQASPTLSLELIEAIGAGKNARIIDIGGGASLLVDHLLDRGYPNLTVLDISANALRRAKERLGERAGRVIWLEADATAGELGGPYDIWHDRAVFHFLTDPQDRTRYVQAVERAIAPGGHLIIATFSLEGPPKCSGLDVKRYSSQTLQEEFGGRFQLVETREELHTTPANVRQAFLYARFQKSSHGA